jgi:hypothetical protein
MRGGEGKPGDYAGGGGNLVIECSTNCTNRGTLAGGNNGAAADGRKGRISALADGERRTIDGRGGAVTISGSGAFDNVAGSQVLGGTGGDARAPAGTALRGTGWVGGDVDVNFLGNVTVRPADLAGPVSKVRGGAAGYINSGTPQAPAYTQPKDNGGKMSFRGLNLTMNGDFGRTRGESGELMAARTNMYGTNSISIGAEAYIANDTVLLSAPFITAVQTPGGHGRIEATSSILIDAGCTGFVNFSMISAAYGPLLVTSPEEASDVGMVVISPNFSPSLPLLDQIVVGDLRISTLGGADFNGDSSVDFFDYDDFVMCFEGAGCPSGRNADFNNDGSTDFFDYDDFVAAFEAGC